MMKFLIATIFCTLFCSSVSAKDFMFVGIYQQKSNDSVSCSDYLLVKQEFDTKEEAVAYKNDFFLNDNYYAKKAELFSPGRSGLIYQYKRWLPAQKCDMTAIATIEGSSIEEAKSKLAKHVNEFKKYFLSEPQIILTWNGGGYSTIIKRNYDGLEVLYTSLKSSSGKSTVHAKMVNTHSEKTAQVTFLVNGKQYGESLAIPPNGHGNYSLGRDVESFEVEIGFVESQNMKDASNNSVIEAIKDIVRDSITTKDGMMKSDATGVGVRG